MDKQEKENWERIKAAMEKSGSTDNHYYKRACAIIAGSPDPIEPLPTEPLE